MKHPESISIFDIETAPDLEAVARLSPPFDREAVKTTHIKDAVRAEEKVEREERKYWQAIHKKAALNPATARIVAIGVHHHAVNPLVLGGTETELLRAFWREFRVSPVWAFWSGNNGRGAFDPRFLIVRSWVNRVPIPVAAFAAKGSPGKLSPGAWIDLAPRFLIGAESGSTCSANRAARTLGIVGMDLGWAVIQDKDALERRGVTGANFHECWEDPLRNALAREYLLNDLAIERAIADVVLGKEVAA
jgi:hypothetical protein